MISLAPAAMLCACGKVAPAPSQNSAEQGQPSHDEEVARIDIAGLSPPVDSAMSQPGAGGAGHFLRAGMSFDELCAFLLQRGPVHGIWPAPPNHQFTAAVESQSILGVTASVGHPSLSYYFIFIDGTLARIVEGVQPGDITGDTAVAANASESFRVWCEHARSWSARILAAPAIEIAQFEGKVADDLRALAAASRGGPANASRIASSTDVPSRSIDAYQAIRARYDPFRLRCGMPVHEVEALMGTSIHQQALADARTALVFGDPQCGQVAAPLVLVVARDQHVEAIYTNLFFDSAGRDLIEARQALATESPIEPDADEAADTIAASQEAGR